jgi:hypothetical protein
MQTPSVALKALECLFDQEFGRFEFAKLPVGLGSPGECLRIVGAQFRTLESIWVRLF